MKHIQKLITRSLFLGIALVASSTLVEAQYIWSGAGSDNNWSTGANWGGTGPGSGSNTTAVTFSGTVRLSPNLDVSATLSSLMFTGKNFVLGSTNSSGLTFDANTASTGFILKNAYASGYANETVNVNITVSNTLAGVSQIGVSGNNTLTLGGSITANTATQFNASSNGKIYVNGALTAASAISFANVSGSGTGTILVGGSTGNSYTSASATTITVGANTSVQLNKSSGNALVGTTDGNSAVSIVDTNATVSTASVVLVQSNQIEDHMKLSLQSSTTSGKGTTLFDLNGKSETLLSLTIQGGANNYINFGTIGDDVDAILTLTNGLTRVSGTLTITGMGSGDAIRSLTTFTSLLSYITIDGAAATSSNVTYDGTYYYLALVPEPGTMGCLLLGGCMMSLMLIRRRKNVA